MLYQDMAGEAQPPFTAESLGKPLLLNSHVRDFLTGFPMQDWPKVVEYVMLYGLRSLFSTYPPGSIASTADLDSITSTARRDLASLSPLRRPRRKAPEPVTSIVAVASPPRPSVPLTDHRKPRPDALYHYPFVDNQGTVEDVLSDGQQWSFFDLDSREQERISRKVFEELKTSVSGLSPDDVPYALRCVGIGLSDMQVHRLFPRLCAKRDPSAPGRLERPVSMSQWMAMLGTLRAVLQPSESEERGGARGSAAPSTGMDSPAFRPQAYESSAAATPRGAGRGYDDEEADVSSEPSSTADLPPPPARTRTEGGRAKAPGTRPPVPPSQAKTISSRSKAAARPSKAPGRPTMSSTARAQKPTGGRAAVGGDQPVVPRSLQHVQSKIKPQLDARREYQRKVRGAREEAVMELIAERRLRRSDPDFDAYRERLNKSGASTPRRPHSASPRLQGSRGANAREIADAFLDSPLMSQLSDDRGPRRRPVAEDEEEDMGLSRDRSTMNLGGWVRREGREAGGAAASVGSSRSEGQAERRRYQHWVGDYGPLHTWAVREQEDDDEEEEDRDDPRSEAGEGKDGDVTQTTEAYRDHLNERVKETFRKEKEKIMRKLRERAELSGSSAAHGGAGASVEGASYSTNSLLVALSSSSSSSPSSSPGRKGGRSSLSVGEGSGRPMHFLSSPEQSVDA